MKAWTEADLPVLPSGVEFIRWRSDVYLGSRPWAPAIVKEMVGDLILRGAQPIRIDTTNGWWKISVGNDWLQEERIANRVEMVFKTIAQFPAKGLNAMRGEVLVGAACERAATVGSDGVTWISEPFGLDTVPKALEVPRLDGWGRLLVFSVRGEGGSV